MRWIRAAVGSAAIAATVGIISTCPALFSSAQAHDSCVVGTTTIDTEMRTTLTRVIPQVSEWTLLNSCHDGGVRQLSAQVEEESFSDVATAVTGACGLPKEISDPWSTELFFVCSRDGGQYSVRVSATTEGTRIFAQAF